MKKPLRKIEVIVSSCRPFAQSEEYAKHQKRAIQSWLNIGNQIILINQPSDCPGLEGVSFIGGDTNPPTIKHVIQSACDSIRDECSPILFVNSDIMLSPSTAQVMIDLQAIKKERVYGVTSQRYWLDGSLPIGEAFSCAQVRDLGLDFFLCPKRVWQEMLKEISPVLTIGRPLWDTWLAGWMFVRLSGNYYDVTKRRLVFHPDHDRTEYDRLTNFTEQEVQTVKMLAFGSPNQSL